MKTLSIIAALFVSGAMAQVRTPGPGGESLSSGGGAPSGSYSHEYTIALGNSSQIPAAQSNFTVLVCANITLGNGSSCYGPSPNYLAVTGSGGAVTSSSGYDIVFSSSTCSSPTLLNWEIPAYTGSTGAVEAWVGIPSLTAGGTLYMCVGNSAITSFQGGAVGTAWGSCGGSSWQRVWHLPNGSSLSANDSSGCGSAGTIGSAAATAGEIDGGAGTTGGSYVSLPYPSLSGSSNWSTSMWLYMAANSNGYNTVFDTAGGARGMSLFVASTGTLAAAYGVLNVSTLTGLTAGAWHYLVIVQNASGSSMYLYVDGALNSTKAGSSASFTAASQEFGANPSGGGSNWVGAYDEIRVTNTGLSANWVTTEYNNQSNPSGFMTVSLTY